MKKLAGEIIKSGVIIGAGASISPTAAGGLGNMAAALPTMGTMGGAAVAIKALKQIKE